MRRPRRAPGSLSPPLPRCFAGTDGCAPSSICILTSTPLSRTTAYVAPSVTTLIKLNLTVPAATPPAGGGGLSDGAVAGIAVGAALGGLAAAAAAWALVTRWRRRRQRTGSGGKLASEESGCRELAAGHPSPRGSPRTVQHVWAAAAMQSSGPIGSQGPLFGPAHSLASGGPSVAPQTPARPPRSPTSPHGSPGSVSSQRSPLATPRSFTVSGPAVRASPFAAAALVRRGSASPPGASSPTGSPAGSPTGSPDRSPGTTVATSPPAAGAGSAPPSTSTSGGTVTGPAAADGGIADKQTSTSSEAGQPVLPELVQHAAYCDALSLQMQADSLGSQVSSRSVPGQERPLLSPRALSPALQEWLVSRLGVVRDEGWDLAMWLL